MAQSTLAMSRKEFCQQFGVGNTLFYKMQKTGEGPKLMRVGCRILIAHDTALAWMRSREEATKPAKTKAPVAPAPVLAAQDATRANSIEENATPRLAVPRRTVITSTDSRVNMGGM